MALTVTPSAKRAAAFASLDSRDYRRHALHATDLSWVEKNCYVDVWIELIHALGLDPMAMLAFTVAVDFEGDQWTFFKPPHQDLRLLYGLDVQELYVWRPLLDHALEHLAAGKFISTEADAFWLPDTAGTDYRQQHTKTTIVLGEIDVEAQRAGYFHNAGYFSLTGEDFVNLFRLDVPADPTFMPMFAELVRYDRAVRVSTEQLRATSRQLLAKHVEWLPADNPVERFRLRFERDLPAIASHGMANYHAWVFGTLRQLGAAAELSALYLGWLDPAEPGRYGPAAAAFTEISTICKSLIMKVARAVNSKRTLDSSASFDAMGLAWDRATVVLRSVQ